MKRAKRLLREHGTTAVGGVMPETLNQAKGAKIGDRQRQLSRKWHGLGLLSEAGLAAVEGEE